ncbi:MAG: tRNA (adenosine(37)-N6)-dimethylallyltransferase [Christensenellales bacterium]
MVYDEINAGCEALLNEWTRTQNRGSIMDKPKVVAVVGTNASGKSALGVRLAKTFDGEIISADSRQVFRGLDLGSGKITPEEMQGVPHYLIDVREPGEFFSMADFQKLSYEKIDEIHARGHLPMIVGGTGLCRFRAGRLSALDKESIWPTARSWKADHTHALRKACFACAGCAGGTHNATASCACLNVFTMERCRAREKARFDSLRLGVLPRDVLAKRLTAIDMRLEQGMIEEVQRLMDEGASVDFLLGLGLEYRFITQYLIGEIPDKDDMLAQLAHAIKKFAKRQMTWFRRNPDIIWLDMQGDAYGQACGEIEKFLKK